ncbi:c-type cytochrome [Phenylobacterium sp. LjRoot225]|uniref:c-type cytochrome n=1 Tax=Phenylobacterium sp. LjRoot225 TaxID=3342285 RepID=UPI003ECC4734
MADRPQRRRWRAAAVVAATALSLLGGVALAGKLVSDRLVAADPDALAANAASVRFGRAHGALLFREHCAACHGADGRGDPAAGAANLADRDWLYGSGRTSEIEGVIAHGIRAEAPKTWKLADMPAFGRARPSAADPTLQPLAAGEVSDLIDYLQAVEGRGPGAPAAERGRVVYTARGCHDCHGADGQGDPGIGAPNLADDVWLYGHGGREDIRRSLLDGRRGRCPAWADRLSPGEIRQVALYVHSLSETAR